MWVLVRSVKKLQGYSLSSKEVNVVFADCESYCKPVKGNLKINMKKYCKKDYGKKIN